MNFSPKFNDFLIEEATPIVTNGITGRITFRDIVSEFDTRKYIFLQPRFEGVSLDYITGDDTFLDNVQWRFSGKKLFFLQACDGSWSGADPHGYLGNESTAFSLCWVDPQGTPFHLGFHFLQK